MPDKRKVLLGWFRSGDRFAPYARRLQEAGLEVIPNPHGRLLNEEELIQALPGVFATVASMEPYTERVLREAKDLRVIARFGVGYDRIDVEAATRHGVIVAGGVRVQPRGGGGLGPHADGRHRGQRRPAPPVRASARSNRRGAPLPA